MSTQPKLFITPEQFMEREAAADHKSEYLNGEVFAMAGASLDHNRIVRNAMGSLYRQLENGPCEVFGSDLMVLVQKTGLRTYPDVSGTCSTPEITKQTNDLFLNPAFIIEVLSPSTEAYDRGKKFEHYKTIPSLREYILISLDRKNIDLYQRQPDGDWKIFTGLETVELSSVPARLTKDELYRSVTSL